MERMNKFITIPGEYAEYDTKGMTAINVRLYLNKKTTKTYENQWITIYDIKDGYDGKVLIIKQKKGLIGGSAKVIMRAVEPYTRTELESIIKPIKPVMII